LLRHVVEGAARYVTLRVARSERYMMPRHDDLRHVWRYVYYVATMSDDALRHDYAIDDEAAGYYAMARRYVGCAAGSARAERVTRSCMREYVIDGDEMR